MAHLFASSKPTAAPQLCDDILDLIFSILKDDTATLKSSRLVCRRWAATSQRHIFHCIRILPSNDGTLQQLLTQHPHSETVIPNVRDLEAYGTPGKVFTGCNLLNALTIHLTHLTLRNSLIASFDLILTAVANSPNLISLGLLDMAFPRVPPRFQYAGRFLPQTLRRLRLRQVPLHPFLLWLVAHPTLPPLTHLDIGSLDDAVLPLATSYVKHITASLRHFTMGFGRGGGATLRGCVYSLNNTHSPPRKEPTLHPIRPGDLFYKLYGIAPCTVTAQMENLSVLQIDGFVDQDVPSESPAEFFAARVFASAPATKIRRVVLGLNISSVSQLCQYNIDWSFFDQVFSNAAYSRLDSIEIRNSGRGDIENITDFVSSRWPILSARGILVFRSIGRDSDARE